MQNALQNVLKNHFWVVGVLSVIVCATFAAKAAGYLLTAQFLGDAKISPKVTPIAKAADTSNDKPVHDKNGVPLETRNMWCSACVPPEPTTPVAGASPDGSVPITSLPLSLLATNIGGTEADSYATVVNTSDQRQGAYSVGDQLPGANGKIRAIRFQYVDFENNSRIERLMLQGSAPPAVAAAPPPAKKDDDDKDKDDLQAAIDSGIKKIDDTTFEIDKSLVDKVLVNPMAIAKGARVVPSAKGFKLYAIRPSSVFSKLGLSNGDTLSSINGMELTTAEKALEVYTKLKDATNLEMEVTRRGKPVTLKYSIR